MSASGIQADCQQRVDDCETGVVLHQGAIGDFVLTLSVVAAVRAAQPVERVVAIASAESARLAAGRSVIDAYVSPDAVGMHTLFGTGDVDERLASQVTRAAWVLSCLGDAQSPISQRLAALRPGGVLALDPRPQTQTLTRRRHITAQWAHDLRSAGLALGEPVAPRIHVSGKEDVGHRRVSLAEGRTARRVVIHPGGGAREKCWPLERLVVVADGLVDARILWLLGPAEAERFPEWGERLQVRAAAGPREKVLIEADLSTVAERIAGADLYIGNDTGPTHLAAALGVPTVAIYGPTDPCVWRPLNANVRVVAPPVPGAIEQVSVSQVVAAIETTATR